MKLYTKSNIYYPLLLLFINIMLLNGVKNLQIGLHALILNENVLSLRNVFFGLHIQQRITLKVFMIGTNCLQY